MKYIFNPCISLFDIAWIIVIGLIGDYFGAPWLFWVLLIPMSVLSHRLTQNFKNG